MVEVTEPETEVALDTPAGLVRVRVAVEDGRATAVTLRNVPSFLLARDREIDGVPYDMAYGGNFYALVEASRGRHGRRPGALGRADRPRAGDHGRDQPRRRARAPRGRADLRLPPRRLLRGRARRRTRNATAIEPGWLDRSPCGTGTSARMAQLHARGELALGEDFVNESVIGTRFTGRLVEETTVGGLPAVVPGDHRPRVGDRDGPVPARPERSVPRGLRACELAGRRRARRGHHRRLRGARARARRRDASRSSSAAAAGARAARGATPACWCPSHARPIAAPESLRAGLGWMVQAGLAVRPQAQAVARAVAGALPPGLDGAARGGRARRCSAGCAARASACSGSWPPRGSTAASTSRAA